MGRNSADGQVCALVGADGVVRSDVESDFGTGEVGEVGEGEGDLRVGKYGRRFGMM